VEARGKGTKTKALREYVGNKEEANESMFFSMHGGFWVYCSPMQRQTLFLESQDSHANDNQGTERGKNYFKTRRNNSYLDQRARKMQAR